LGGENKGNSGEKSQKAGGTWPMKAAEKNKKGGVLKKRE